ncbi:MAG: hypothetical protein ACREE1_11485, partial [Stellaceae bacterium]
RTTAALTPDPVAGSITIRHPRSTAGIEPERAIPAAPAKIADFHEKIKMILTVFSPAFSLSLSSDSAPA